MHFTRRKWMDEDDNQNDEGSITAKSEKMRLTLKGDSCNWKPDVANVFIIQHRSMSRVTLLYELVPLLIHDMALFFFKTHFSLPKCCRLENHIYLMWKLHHVYFFQKCSLGKRKTRKNAISETILQCLCMSFFFFFCPTLCYDMHQGFQFRPFHLHVPRGIQVNVGERRHDSATCSCRWICVQPSRFCPFEVKPRPQNAAVDNVQSFWHCALLVHIVLYIVIYLYIYIYIWMYQEK